MLRKLDLASIAEDIVAAYRPVPLASLGSLQASLFICQGRTPWHRRFEGDELLFVLEGVISLDAAGARLVVNEGEVASAPGTRTYNAHSGMRSTVVLVEHSQILADAANGHHTDQSELPGELSKANPGVEVRRRPAFEWLPVGRAGQFDLAATRVRGSSEPYRVSDGPVLMVVYRGVMDYQTPDASGTLVGSNMLTVPEGTEITLSAERGATLLMAARSGARLPVSATPDLAAPDEPDPIP